MPPRRDNERKQTPKLPSDLPRRLNNISAMAQKSNGVATQLSVCQPNAVCIVNARETELVILFHLRAQRLWQVSGQCCQRALWYFPLT
jgi:hypothetical protein